VRDDERAMNDGVSLQLAFEMEGISDSNREFCPESQSMFREIQHIAEDRLTVPLQEGAALDRKAELATVFSHDAALSQWCGGRSHGGGGATWKQKRPLGCGHRLPCLTRSTAKTSPNATDSNALTTRMNITRARVALLSRDMADLLSRVILLEKSATPRPAV